MKYHLIALFDNKSNRSIEITQKNLCKKYRLYKLNHQFYIPLQTVINPDIDKFDKIISDTLAPYKKFKVQINPNIFLDNSLKTINLKVESKGYIIRIIRNITDTLTLSRFNVKDDYDKKLYITLANSNYLSRKVTSGQEKQSSFTYKCQAITYDFAKINRLELWKSTNNKKGVLVKSYPLRDF